MTLRPARTNKRARNGGFTLIEVLLAFVIFTITISGLIYGYVQANRMAEWASMSLAAQSYAMQGLEQARSAQWNAEASPVTYNVGGSDELPTGSTGQTNYIQSDTMDVPETDAPILVTNSITVRNIIISGSTSVQLREIRSDVYWNFPLDNTPCTNTAITLRAPDQ